MCAGTLSSQVNQAGGMLTATWMFDDPRTAQTQARRQTMGAFLVLPSLRYACCLLEVCASALRMSCIVLSCLGVYPSLLPSALSLWARCVSPVGV